MTVEIRRGQEADLDAAATVLGLAFADASWTRWTVAADHHVDRITALQRLVIERAVLPFGELWVATDGDDIVGVASWMLPDRVPQPAVWEAMRAETACLEGDRHEYAEAAEGFVAGLKPRSRHYFLGAVGVTPNRQGQGIGSAFLRPVLARADSERVDVYLETSKAANVTFYEQRGFAVTGECRIPDGGPPVWAMTRAPAVEASGAR